MKYQMNYEKENQPDELWEKKTDQLEHPDELSDGLWEKTDQVKHPNDDNSSFEVTSTAATVDSGKAHLTDADLKENIQSQSTLVSIAVRLFLTCPNLSILMFRWTLNKAQTDQKVWDKCAVSKTGLTVDPLIVKTS